MFLDADGEILAQPPARSVASFEATLEKIERWRALSAKARKGDRKAAAEAFLTELALGRLGLEEARARLKELSLTQEQRQQAETWLVEIEVADAMQKARRDQGALRRAQERFFELQAEGKAPPEDGNPVNTYYFWSGVAEIASERGQDDLAKKARNRAQAALKRLQG